MDKTEKQKINDKYDKKKTPYDYQLKCSIKEISSLKQMLSLWESAKKNQDYSIYSLDEIEKYIKIVSDRLEMQKNNKSEIENKIYHYKKEKKTIITDTNHYQVEDDCYQEIRKQVFEEIRQDFKNVSVINIEKYIDDKVKQLKED